MLPIVEPEVQDLKDTLKEASEKGARVLNKIMRNCLLITVTCHRWRGQYTMEDAEVMLDGEPVPEKRITPSRWKLLPEKWRDKFNVIESNLRLTVAKYSVPFALHGVYIVPLSRAEDLFQALDKLRVELATQSEIFCSEENYNSMVNDLREELGGEHFQEVEKVIPTRFTMRRKFSIVWAVAPIGSPEASNLLDNPSEYVREAREATNKLINQSVQAMLLQPRQELAATLEDLVTMLSKDERRSIRNATLTNLGKMFEKIKSFSFMADDELLKKIQNAEGELEGLSAKDINREQDIAGSLTTVFRSIISTAKDESKVLESFNKFNRDIDFGD